MLIALKWLKSTLRGRKRDGKEPKFWVRVWYMFLDDKSSVLYRVGSVRFGFLHIFTFGLRSVLRKTQVLVRFVLHGFGFFPISRKKTVCF